MTAARLIEEMKVLPVRERAYVVEATIRESTTAERKSLERFLRRL